MLALTFLTATLVLATPHLTVKKQRELSATWAKKHSFPLPMPIIPTPKYCSKHPQECPQDMKKAEQYWHTNVINDVIKSTKTKGKMTPPPKSGTVGQKEWYKYWRRFADLLKANKYPQPPNRQESNEWCAYWKGVLNHGEDWPNHSTTLQLSSYEGI